MEQLPIKYIHLGILFFLISFMFIARIGFYLVAACMKEREHVHSLMVLYNIALYSLIGFIILLGTFYD